MAMGLAINAAIITICRNIENSPGWQAAEFFNREGVITDRQSAMLVDFDRDESDGMTLTRAQRYARGEINKVILNSYSDLDLFTLGIDVWDITIAKNGWRRD